MKEDDSNSSGIQALRVLGLPIHQLSVTDLISAMLRMIHHNQRGVVANVNIHAMNLAHRLDWFRAFLNDAEIVFCDGFGVKWASRFLGTPVRFRYTPPDWIDAFAAECAKENRRWFLLGGKAGVAEKAATAIKEKTPDLGIAGTQHGYFDKTAGGRENDGVVERINKVKPDVLFVGFGMPLQEKWLADNWDKLHVPLALPVGALFDYVSGDLRRGPKWCTDYDLEWLARLLIEPRRLGRRYLLGGPAFAWRVLLAKIFSQSGK